MADTPTDRAEQLLNSVDHAHARLKQAWQTRPDGDLQTGQTSTGRITSSEIPDPASHAAANLERLRGDVLTRIVDITADLADVDAINADPSPVFRCRRLTDVLALHRQYAATLLTRIRQLQADPACWDDAQSLTGTLASHTQQIVRTSHWAYGKLAQPDADPSIRQCKTEGCQNVAEDNSVWCRTCREREERRQVKQEQRRRQIRADRENGLRCWGQIRDDCDAMLSDTDRARNATNCGACRKWKHDEAKRLERASSGAVAVEYHDPP